MTDRGISSRAATWIGVAVFVLVVLAIAIPNIVQSRITSGEVSHVSSLFAILAGQATFHRVDHYKKGDLVYANPKDGRGSLDLFELADGTAVGLIDRSLARALAGEQPRAGYFFGDVPCDDYRVEFAVCCAPASYGRSGISVFHADTGGMYQIDAKKLYPDIEKGDRVPLLKKRPTREELAEKWISVGG